MAQDYDDTMQEKSNSFVQKDPGKYEPVRTEPLAVTTARLSSFLQSTPAQCMAKGKLGDTCY
jgi:hypothetical protein